MRRIAPAALLLLLTGCGGPSADEPCGWDLRTDAGVAANGEYLTFATGWIAAHPGEPAPAPTSTFWLGECPAPSGGPPPPPDEEHDAGEH